MKHKYLSIDMPKVKKQSDKERQRLDRIRKRSERATETEVNTTVSENENRSDRENAVDWQDRNESENENKSGNGERSMKCATDSQNKNVPLDAQAIVDKYLQSQKVLADRSRKRKQQYNTEWNKCARSNSEYRKYEQQCKEKSVYRDRERQHNKKHVEMARKNTTYRECNKKRMQVAREDSVCKDNERKCEKKRKAECRKDPRYRHGEREANKKSMQLARKDLVYRDSENEFHKKSMQMARENTEYRQNEQQCDTNRRKTVRKDKMVRLREQMHDTERKKTSRNEEQSVDDLIKNFHKEVMKGPVHKCCVCDQLWYRHSVVTVQRNSLSDCFAVDVWVPDISQSEVNEMICNTCLSHLKKEKIRPSATANGMGFPEIPQHLKDLHQVEWRLVLPRIPFMKVFAAPRGGQKKIRGNVVNVPCDTVNTFQVLPHWGNEQQTIQVKIKRDLRYTNHVMSQNVRPYKVREAAEYLVTHGKLFKDQGISFDKTWAENNELSNNIDVNERSSSQIDTNVREPYIDGRAISSDIPGEHQTGCSDWNDSLNLTVREGQMEFGTVIGVNEPQPGCSHWDGSLNNAVNEGQMEFGAVTKPATKSDDGNEIEGVIEFRVITGEGDEIEIELEPQIVPNQERQEKPGPISDRENQDHTEENDEEQWSENEDDQENSSGVLDTLLTLPDFLEEGELQYVLAPGQGRTPVSVFKDKYSEELAYPNIYIVDKVD